MVFACQYAIICFRCAKSHAGYALTKAPPVPILRKNAWRDRQATSGPISWRIVNCGSHASDKHHGTCAHVIMMQDVHDETCAAVAHSSFHGMAHFEKVPCSLMRLLGKPMAEEYAMRGIACSLEFLRHGRRVSVDREQQVWIDAATILGASVTHAGSDHSESDTEGDDVSTRYESSDGRTSNESDVLSGASSSFKLLHRSLFLHVTRNYFQRKRKKSFSS